MLSVQYDIQPMIIRIILQSSADNKTCSHSGVSYSVSQTPQGDGNGIAQEREGLLSVPRG
jgi:hypothetical protein